MHSMVKKLVQWTQIIQTPRFWRLNNQMSVSYTSLTSRIEINNKSNKGIIWILYISFNENQNWRVAVRDVIWIHFHQSRPRLVTQFFPVPPNDRVQPEMAWASMFRMTFPALWGCMYFVCSSSHFALRKFESPLAVRVYTTDSCLCNHWYRFE